MDPVEQTVAAAEQASSKPQEAPAAEEASAAAEEVAAPTEPAAKTPEKDVTLKEPEPEHKVCPNCGYHDASGKDVPRCPGCYFRFNSEPVHQAPVMRAEPEEEAKPEDAKAEAEVKAEEETAGQKSVVDGDKSVVDGDKQDAEIAIPAGKAAGVTIAVEAEAPTEQLTPKDAATDAGKAVEEKL